MSYQPSDLRGEAAKMGVRDAMSHGDYLNLGNLLALNDMSAARAALNAWDVLRRMTPTVYARFSEALGPSSAFQSYPYRITEYALGWRFAGIQSDFCQAGEPA